jgi:hypothetical protein
VHLLCAYSFEFEVNPVLETAGLSMATVSATFGPLDIAAVFALGQWILC